MLLFRNDLGNNHYVILLPYMSIVMHFVILFAKLFCT